MRSPNITTITTALLSSLPGPLALCVSLLLPSLPVTGHHSGSMFDQNQQVMLNGTVREFQWTNPHSWLQLQVTDDKAGLVEWSIEMGPPSALYRKGWRASSLKPGDKVSVTINPVRDGQKAGNYVSGSRPDGTTLGPP